MKGPTPYGSPEEPRSCRCATPRRQPDRQRHRDRVRAGRARLAGGAQPRVRLPRRRRGAAGADRAEIQGRGHQRRDRRAACSEIVRDGLSVYRVDGEALKALAPDVIVTQDHCEVCAVSLSDVEAATCTWTGRPVEHRLAEAGLHRRRLRRHPPRGRRARCAAAGEALVARHAAPASTPSARRWPAGRRPRVAFIEWVEPLMAGGNWMPELIEAAGGHNLFGAGRQAFRLDAVGRAGRRRPRGDRGRALRLWPRALPGGAAAAASQARLGGARRPCAAAASTSPTATPTSTAPARASPTAPRCWRRCCIPIPRTHATGTRPGSIFTPPQRSSRNSKAHASVRLLVAISLCYTCPRGFSEERDQ